jgi:D-lactate dehydrogenase
MIEVAVYDTKPYDRHFLSQYAEKHSIKLSFHEYRLKIDIVPAIKNAQAVCVFVNDKVDAACIDLLAQQGVKHIALRCAGFNNVDIKRAKEKGIHVTRVPAYSPHAVAEHAVGLLLTLNRKIHRAFNRVREHNFSLNGLVGFDIYNKTVGIVGTGKIGKIAAQIFRGFEAKVLAYDPFPSQDWAKKFDIEYVSFEKLLNQSDVISLHLPLTPESSHLLNSKTFGQMKHGAFLINTSRGKLIDTPALIEALKKGKLSGVALDVYEEEEGVFFEDLSDQVLLDDGLSRLLTFPNVLITSHQAFLTQEALNEIARVTMENIARADKKQPFLDGTSL